MSGEEPSKSRTIEDHIRNGVIVLDKWPGPTSRDVVECIRKIFGIRHAGHAGTLE